MEDASLSFIEIDAARQEIDDLRKHQSEAIRSATFIGMTTDEAKDYERRQVRIARLLRELMILQNPY